MVLNCLTPKGLVTLSLITLDSEVEGNLAPVCRTDVLCLVEIVGNVDDT